MCSGENSEIQLCPVCNKSQERVIFDVSNRDGADPI